MFRINRFVLCLLFLAGFILAASPSAQPERVHAQGSNMKFGFLELSAEFFEEHRDRLTFFPGDVITVTGAIPPNAICGDNVDGLMRPFVLFPTADIYVMENQRLSVGDKLEDVSGEPNRAIGTSTGLFIDEVIAIVHPAGHFPAETARYTVVMDVCMDGVLGPFDIVLGNAPSIAFQVLGGGDLTEPDLHPLKRKADYYTRFLSGISVDQTVKLELVPGVCSKIRDLGAAPPSSTSPGAIARMVTMSLLAELAWLQCQDLAQHWRGIAADPPRFDFDELAELGPVDYHVEPLETPLHRATQRLANALAEQAAISQALLVTLERFQGAQLAGDHAAMVRQLERMDHLISLLSGPGGNLFRTYASLEAFELALKDDPDLADVPEAQELVDLFPEWRRSIGGLVDPLGHRFHLILETDRLVPVGLRAWIEVYLGQNEFLVAEGLHGIPQARQALRLPPLVPDYPVARATGPYTAPPGRDIEFDASRSQHRQGKPLTFGWDLEGNGVFDDAEGAVVSRAFDGPGFRLVGVKVSDPDGNTDVRYTLVRIGDLTTQDIVVTDSGTKPERGLWHITPEGDVTVIRDDAPIPGNLGGFRLDVNGDIVVATSGLGTGTSVIQRFAADGSLVRTIHQDEVGELIGRGIRRFGDMVIDGRGDIIVLATPEDGTLTTPMLLRIAPDGSRASIILDSIADRESWSLDLSGIAIDPDGNIVVVGWGLTPEGAEINAGVSAMAVDPDDGSFEFAIPPPSWTRPDGIRESVTLTFGGERLFQNLAGWLSAGGFAVDAQGNYIIPSASASNVHLYRVPIPPEFVVLGFNEDTNRLRSGLEVFPLHVNVLGDSDTPFISAGDIAIDRGGDALLPAGIFIDVPGGVWRVTPEGAAFLLADMTDFMDEHSPARIGVVPEVREVTAKDVTPLPNLHITELRAEQEACPGSVQVGVTLQNLGASPAEPPVRAHFFDGDPLTEGVPIGSAVLDASIPPGEFADLEIIWANPPPGAREVHVMAAGARANAPSVALLVCTPEPSDTPVVLEPSEATKLVGETQTLEVRLEDVLGNPMPDIPVTFVVTGANPGAATISTNQDGLAAFTYTGDDAGEDMAVASSGDFTSEPARITWNRPPETDAGGPYFGDESSPVTFDGTGSFDPDGGELDHDWDFGDGNVGTGPMPTHTYSVAGVYDVCLTVTDPFGASETHCTTADIAPATVEDTTPPVVTPPDDITVEAEGPAGIPATNPDVNAFLAGAAAEDDVEGPLPVTHDAPETFPLGETAVTFSATDSSGNTGIATAVVTVVDTTPPDLTVPEDMTVEATSAAGAVVTYEATAEDLVDGPVPVDCDPASGSTFLIGDTAVECTATDNAGNSANATFTVTVVEPTPVASCDDLLLSHYQTSPVDHQFVDITNVGDAPIDINNCSLVTYDAMTEESIGEATVALAGNLAPGETFRVGSAGADGVDMVIPDGALPAGPGGLAVLDAPPPANGTPVKDVLPDNITGMVYLDSMTVFGVAHLRAPEHNSVYECIYGGWGQGPFEGPFTPVAECLNGQ